MLAGGVSAGQSVAALRLLVLAGAGVGISLSTVVARCHDTWHDGNMTIRSAQDAAKVLPRPTAWKFKGRRHYAAMGEVLVWECITPFAAGAEWIIRPSDYWRAA